MDQAVIQYYRRLLKSGFNYNGAIENPTIFLDPSIEAVTRICTGPVDYMNIYIKISEDTVEEIKYLCICEPITNVAVEATCKLIQGKKLNEAASMREEEILEEIGSNADELREKVSALLELLRNGFNRYKSDSPPKSSN